MDRILQMILNKILNRVVNRAVDSGIDYASRGGKPKSQMTEAEKTQARQSQDLTKRFKQVRQATRRLF